MLRTVRLAVLSLAISTGFIATASVAHAAGGGAATVDCYLNNFTDPSTRNAGGSFPLNRVINLEVDMKDPYNLVNHVVVSVSGPTKSDGILYSGPAAMDIPVPFKPSAEGIWNVKAQLFNGNTEVYPWVNFCSVALMVQKPVIVIGDPPLPTTTSTTAPSSTTTSTTTPSTTTSTTTPSTTTSSTVPPVTVTTAPSEFPIEIDAAPLVVTRTQPPADASAPATAATPSTPRSSASVASTRPAPKVITPATPAPELANTGINGTTTAVLVIVALTFIVIGVMLNLIFMPRRMAYVKVKR